MSKPPLDSSDEADPRQRFLAAWSHIDRARSACDRLAAAWDTACLDAFDAHLSDWDGQGSIWVELNFDPTTSQLLNDHARAIGTHLREALDEGLVALARLVSGVIAEPEPDRVRFPICDSSEEFLAFYRSGCLDGVRPDHLEFLEAHQPYIHDIVGDDSDRRTPDPLRFIRDLSDLEPDADAVMAWCHSAQPEISVAEPARISDLTIEPDGAIVDTKTVATFQVIYPPDLPPANRPRVFGNPMVAFDLMAATDDPIDIDDTVTHRAATAIQCAARILASFEWSMGLRKGSSIWSWDPRSRLPSGSPATAAAFARVSLGDLIGPDASSSADPFDGIVTVDGGEELTLAITSGDQVYLRRIPAATALDPRFPQGTAAELAVATAEATRGLPDFVFPPVKRRTGSGTREIGDGIVHLGDKGLILQVKSRTNVTDRLEREASWIRGQVEAGAKQAAGTLRQLRLQPAVLTNQRGREVSIDGNAPTAWIGVVLIDHAKPPHGVTPLTTFKNLPVVALLRRDWEFLFDQLGSTPAVVRYLHRVAGEPLELGEESVRYFDLAGKDLAAEPIPARNNWATVSGGDPASHPILPMEPAPTGTGQAMFRLLLNDIAESRLEADEIRRIELLAFLDGTPVIYHESIGDRLLELLEQAKQVQAGQSSWSFRWVFDAQRPHQACFGVSNQYSNHHKVVFRARLELQHHRMTLHDWSPNDEPQTTGVLLTPNYGRSDRLWDTSTFMIRGKSGLTEVEATEISRAWAASQAPPTSS